MLYAEVERFNPFQRLVVVVTKELWKMGYDSYGATDERIERIASCNPRAREALNETGCEWVWDESDRARLCNAVRQNMALRESRMYVFGDIVHLEVSKCPHGSMVFCQECWEAGQKIPPERRR